MRSLLPVLLLVPFAGALLAPPAFAAQPFDGQWSVEVITEKGTCDQAYRWNIRVSEGHVVTTPDMPARATGSISPKGAISVNFSRGNDTMSAKGSASGDWASGEWTAPTLGCTGRFRAERRA